MDNHTQITVVSVHSPLIQFSSTGSYYTSYAISLKSNNPCFTHAYSQIRRRYSEFLELRSLLAEHHPTAKPPPLPPKNYFHRFSDSLIEERKTGLQKFLEQVLATPVYLSDKSLHLFLQSPCSMSQIGEQCDGDIPTPQLMDDEPLKISYHSDISSNSSSEKWNKITTNRTFDNIKESPKSEDADSDESGYSSPTPKQHTIPTSHKCNSTVPCMIPRRQGSLDSSPCSSISSLDTSYSLPVVYNDARHVSFNENVTVAVVYNQLWNINIRPIRTSV